MPFNLRSHYLYTATSAQPPARPVCSNYGSRLGGRTQRRYLSPTSSPAIGFLFISSLFGVCAPWCGEVKIGFARGDGRARARERARAGSGAPAGAGGNETRGGVCGRRGGPHREEHSPAPATCLREMCRRAAGWTGRGARAAAARERGPGSTPSWRCGRIAVWTGQRGPRGPRVERDWGAAPEPRECDEGAQVYPTGNAGVSAATGRHAAEAGDRGAAWPRAAAARWSGRGGARGPLRGRA